MRRTSVLALVVLIATTSSAIAQTVFRWSQDFPQTDFARRSIDLAEIVTYGSKDSIPPIDDPQFAPVTELTDIGPLEPVLSIGINGDLRAYPLQVLLFHEIVNDTVGGVPVVVSYCAFCNSGIVFDRRLDGQVLEFGNTGTYRHFGMMLYDKTTQSWWQQFIGEAVVGELLGRQLDSIPARLESFANFIERAPDGQVLVPSNRESRPYGQTPYRDYERLPASAGDGRFSYDLPPGVDPMERVVVVDDQAWTVDLVRSRGEMTVSELQLTWEPGQNSVHDKRVIADGRDVGNILVQRQTDSGVEDVRYDVSFAFTFAAFVPGGTLLAR